MYNNQIAFKAAFGNEDKLVNIYFSNGSGGGSLHLLFDRLYQGVILYRNNEWVVLLQQYTDEYTTAEIETLLEIVKTNFKIKC